MERLMTDEQRSLFRETQAVMSLLEGFGDHVMDEVGKDIVPGVERISARFHGRRQQRTPFERAMLRITGLDLKMEQYRKGEAFVAGIERLAGAAALRRLWDSPETLPTADELLRPEAWVGRMGLAGAEGGSG
jgi:putative hydrolase